METKITFTFTFNVEGRAYAFNEVADTKEDALLMLRADLATIIQQVNDAKDN